MNDTVTSTDIELCEPAMQRPGCACTSPMRRLFGSALLASGVAAALPAKATIAECKRSNFTKAVSADQVEGSAVQQYKQMLQQADGKRALIPAENTQVQRVRYIAQRIIPFAPECNERARDWQWEVNVLGSRQINAFCMPGGKIAFYYGILSELQLDDDEVAVVMGHEISHALLEHAREQMGKKMVTSGGLRLGAALLGLGNVGDMAAQVGANLLGLKFGRDDESEADSLGLIMAARAGYDPRKGVTLWQKMMGGNKNAPPAILSTHPAGPTRIQDIEGKLSHVLPMYEAAAKPDRRFAPPTKLPPAKPNQQG